jgi:hypothetical protein
MRMRRYRVMACLDPLGAPAMPVADFPFLWLAWLTAIVASAISGIECQVHKLQPAKSC